MKTSVVIGCLIAVFVLVDSRALSASESNTAHVAQVAHVAQTYTADPAASASATPQQLVLQSKSDKVKQDEDKKGIKLLFVY